MRTIVITGATSFLGRNIAKGLLDRGYSVYALVRKNSASILQLPKSPDMHLIYGSMDELKIICDYVQYAEMFIHFAWDGSGYQGRSDQSVQQKNVNYSMKALEMAHKLGCKKFIFSGSQAEYGIVYNEIFEDTKCNPVSEYGKAKLQFSKMAEEFCEQREMKFIHLRIFSVYGIGDRVGTLVDTCIRHFNSGEEVILGSCRQKWNYLYIADFVYMVLEILENDSADGVYNIASKDTRQMREFVDEIYKLSNKTGTYKYTESTDNPEGSPSLNPNIDKVLELIHDYKMKAFADGIKEIMGVI